MSGAETDTNTVREALRFSCDAISQAIGEGCGECGGCLAWAALSHLSGRVTELEQQVKQTEEMFAALVWSLPGQRATIPVTALREAPDLELSTWRESFGSVTYAAERAGEATPKTVLDFDNGEVRVEPFGTQGTVGTSTGSGAGAAGSAGQEQA
jgi:hypothetical protein